MKKEHFTTAKELIQEHEAITVYIQRLENVIPIGLYFLNANHDEDYMRVDADLQFVNELREKTIKKQKDRLKEIEIALSKLK